MADRGSSSTSFCDQAYGGGMSMMSLHQRSGNVPPLKFDGSESNAGMMMAPPSHTSSMHHYGGSSSGHRMNANATTFFNNNSASNNRNWSTNNNSSNNDSIGNGHNMNDGNGGGSIHHQSLITPKASSSMYFNFSRQQRSVSNDMGRPYMNGCHGGNSSSNGGPTPYLQHQQQQSLNTSGSTTLNTTGDSGFSYDTDASNTSLTLNGSAGSCNTSAGSVGSGSGGGGAMGFVPPVDTSVTLQISNIDTSIEDRALKNYLIGKLKPITPILSFVYEGVSMVKIRLPSLHHAKQVVAFLHRKKIRHKRISVAYTSTLEPSTLRCQVAGLLKDIPLYKLSMYKFRELFQSRFKTSISVMDLYDMKDICIISENVSEEKFICLRPELINSIENSELLGCLQLSVPYCSDHFKNGHRGWAELEIEPLPNVIMSVAEVRSIVYTLLKNHKGDIPIASLVYCIEAVVNVRIDKNEQGVNLEHLISCVNGVQIATNKFGIKILSWLGADTVIQNVQQQQQHMQQHNHQAAIHGGPASRYGGYDDNKGVQHYTKFANMNDPFGQISREIIELVKMSPKSMMKFSRFIPAYHNHFGKQCRVADYGYTKLIELFEALTDVIQVMGDGENRQITLTHKCQVRCFTSDVLRLLRSQSSKSVMMSHVEAMFSSHLGRKFDVTDYGVCKLEDIMESVIRNNVVQVENDHQSDDVVLSIPKQRQSRQEMQKTCTFAGEVVDMLKTASQYSISFEKIACSYQFVYGYQCRLNDYGFQKLSDLMEAITGVIEIEMSSNDDRKVYLSPKVAQRVFSEQLRDLTKMMTGSSTTPMSLGTLLYMHKKQFGYQMQPQSLGLGYSWYTVVNNLPFIELTTPSTNDGFVVVCHHEDPKFIFNSYAACRVILESGNRTMPMANFINGFFGRYSQILNENAIKSMGHAVMIIVQNGAKSVCITPTMMFVLRMISVLETMNMVTIAEFKIILNVGITDCFRFGYPNFNSLIASFPDIFLCSAGANDMGEVMLNKQCILVQNGVQNYFRGFGNQMNMMQAAPQAYPYQPWVAGDAPSQMAICMADKSALPPPPNMPMPAVTQQEARKRSESISVPKGSFEPKTQQKLSTSRDEMNVSMMSSTSSFSEFDESEIEKYYTCPEFAPPGIFEEKVEEPTKKRIPLYERKPSAEFDPTKFDQPTPDTQTIPPGVNAVWQPNSPGKPLETHSSSDANYTKNVSPFWMDPVWVHDSPKKPVNIAIPELRTLDTIPSLSSPVVMEGIMRRHPNMFTFEA